MMEAVSISETSVNFYENTRRNITEDSHLHTHRSKNLKFHLFIKQCGLTECLDQVIRTLLRIREVAGSNLGSQTGYPD
jgi:hypothetical protein